MNKVMRGVFGCDPGASGGVAFWHGDKFSAVGMGDDEAVRDFVRANIIAHPGSVAYMEQVGGYIGKEQPGSMMFTFGDANGLCRGLFLAYYIPVIYVPPKTWMREVLPGCLGLEYETRKKALAAWATDRFPQLSVTKKVADALGILEYGLSVEAAPRLVASTGNFRADGKAAEKWAKASGWQIPKKGGKDYLAMVNYYCQHIRK